MFLGLVDISSGNVIILGVMITMNLHELPDCGLNSISAFHKLEYGHVHLQQTYLACANMRDALPVYLVSSSIFLCSWPLHGHVGRTFECLPQIVKTVAGVLILNLFIRLIPHRRRIIHLFVFTVYTTIFFLLWDNSPPTCPSTKGHEFLLDTYSQYGPMDLKKSC